jgi:long-chain acyl-CoA synthetase
MPLNLSDDFRRVARRQPDAPAILGPGREEVLSYGELDEAILRAADALARAGAGPGCCVGLHCPGGARYIAATYAAWSRGACVVPVPVELARPEKEEVLRRVALDFVISPVGTAAFLAPAVRGREVELWPGVAAYPVARRREPPAGLAAVNAAFIRFTSGTTAAAKGVVLSHETIVERTEAANEALRLGPGDRVVWVLSMAYHFAVSIVAYLRFGAAIILPPNHFAGAVLEAARGRGGTVLYASPAHFAWLAAAPEAAPLPALRLAVSTTAPLDRATAGRFLARFGVPVTQALGIIEVGLPLINIDHAADRPEAVGRLLPGYRMRLADVGAGEGAGELQLSGRGLLDAYYDPWQPRSAVLADGWFRTGDVAEVGPDGCVVLRGRVKDVISVLGMKFFPGEVEAVLASHPAVESACVFGRPDPRLGEAAHALVVLKDRQAALTPRDLVEHCAGRLASAKVPQSVTFVDALPRTASGKVLHRPPPP